MQITRKPECLVSFIFGVYKTKMQNSLLVTFCQIEGKYYLTSAHTPVDNTLEK